MRLALATWEACAASERPDSSSRPRPICSTIRNRVPSCCVSRRPVRGLSWHGRRPTFRTVCLELWTEVADFVPLIECVSYFSKARRWSVWPRIDVSKELMHGQDVRDVPLRRYKIETYHSLQRKMRNRADSSPFPDRMDRPKASELRKRHSSRTNGTQGIRRLAQVCDAADVALFHPVHARHRASRRERRFRTPGDVIARTGMTYKHLTVRAHRMIRLQRATCGTLST